jgi:serine/threonine-protein kinase CHEK2
MASHEKSQLKRGRVRRSLTANSTPENEPVFANFSKQSQGEVVESKRIRSDRDESPVGKPAKGTAQLPSPLTHLESNVTDDFKEATLTPPSQSQAYNPLNYTATSTSPKAPGLSSPPSDTQAFSQFVYPPHSRSYAVEDEDGEGVWGYMVPLDSRYSDPLILRRRPSCPVPGSMVGKTSGKERVKENEYTNQEEKYEEEKQKNGITAGGYLLGRHPECGTVLVHVVSVFG